MARSDRMISQLDAPLISRRAYNLLCFGLVTVSFLIMWGEYLFITSSSMLARGASLLTLILPFVGSIGGLVLMSVGKSKQSLGLSLVGYLIFSLTFGFTAGVGLSHYRIGTINYAFGITACLSGIFLILGVTFPDFFASIGRVLVAALLGVILIELVATFIFHAHQTIIDYIVIAIFCGFIGYDSYLLAIDAPTVPNAIWHASDIYIDIVNILIRVLAILGDDR